MNRGMKASLIKEERSVSQDPPLNILLNTCLKNINIRIILHRRKNKMNGLSQPRTMYDNFHHDTVEFK